jgi:hypothetical protein
MKLTLVISFVVCTALAGCTSPNSQTSSSGRSSDKGILTTEKAQRALDKFAQQQRCTIRLKGNGIHEIPAQNIATTDCASSGIHFNRGGQDLIITEPSASMCTAGFTHYTDGRWVLTRVTIGGVEAIEWTPNIEAN